MATKTWNGTADWFTASDWSGGTLPAATDDDIINSGTASLVSGDGAISANSLTIVSGATFLDSDPATAEAIANGIAAAGAFFLQAGATATAGAVNITGNGVVDLDPYFLSGSSGGSGLTVTGTLTNSGTSGNALDIGNGNENASAPDTLTIEGESGGQGLFNTGQINIVGSGAGARATLNVDNASAVAGFGTAGVETGNVFLANNALLEFTAGEIGTIAGAVQLQGPNAFISDLTGTTTNSALTGLTSVTGSLALQAGASITTTGGLSITGTANVDLDPYFLSDSTGGSSLTVAGTLTNSSNNGNALDVGNGNENASAPDTLTIQGVSGNQGLFNTGQINIVGSGAGAEATLDVDNASAVAGFGTAGVETGSLFMANHALLEFTAGEIGTIAGTVQLQGPNAVIADQSGTTTNSALTGLTSVTGSLALQAGASITTTGGLSITGTANVDLDPYFLSDSTGGSSLTVAGTLTNSSNSGNALDVGNGNENASAPDTLTIQGVSGNQGLFNTGQINIVGSGAGAEATLDVDNASAVAGFGTAGVETGSLFMANHALLEFTAGEIGTIAGTVQLQGPNAVIADQSGTTTNSALTGLTSVTGSLALQAGASITTTGGLSITGTANVDLDPYFLSDSTGGSSLTVAGTLTNSSNNGNALDVGNSDQNASAPDTLTIQGVSGNQGLFNTGQINIVGSGAGAEATLDVDNASAVAGFGTAGVETGSLFMANHALLEFTAGEIGTIAGTVQLQGPNAVIADQSGTTTNSALTGLTMVSGFLDLQSGASVTTAGGLNIASSGLVDLDPYFESGSSGGASLTVAGTLTNNGTNSNALAIGNLDQNATAPDTVTIQGVSGGQGLFNTGSINITGSGAGAKATLNIDNASAVAGFGTAGVETGSVSLAGNALVEFTAGQIGTIAGSLQIQGPSAFISDASGTTTSSALTGLTSITGFFNIQAGATVSTTGGLTVSGAGALVLDPDFIADSSGGTSLTIGGMLTNTSSANDGVLIGGVNMTSPDLATLTGGLNNAGSLTVVGASSVNTAKLLFDNSATNTGSVAVEAFGLLTGSGANYTQAGGSTQLFINGTLTAPNIDVTGGALFGDGTVKGTVNNNGGGTVEAYSSENPSIANTLTVSGNYNQSGSGVLEAIVNTSVTPAADVLHVTGNVLLQGGTLLVEPENFAMNTLVTVATFTAGSLVGEFDALQYGNNGPIGDGSFDNLGNGTALEAFYNNNSGEIQVELVTAAASPNSYIWDAGTGNWDTAADWNPPGNGTTPSADSDVTIGSTTNGDVTLSHDATVNSLTIAAQNTLVSGPDLTVGASASVAATGSLSVKNFDVNVPGAVVADAGAITVNGGTLNSLGVVTVSGSLTLINMAVIQDTTLAGAGLMQSASNSTDTLDGVTVSSGSTFTGQNNSVTDLEGTIINAGTIALDAVANTTELRTEPGATVTLTGSGDVDLSNSANNIIRDPIDGTGKLVNVNNTIAGAGTIGDGEMSLDNQASGVIDANLATPLVLNPNSSGFTNEGLLEATAGGTLELDGSGFTQSGGLIEASGAGSTVELVSNTTVTSGTLTSASGGTLETAANQTATLDDVTLSSGSTFTAVNNSITFLEGTLTNDGTVDLDAAANGTELRTEPGATLTLTGGGAINLSNSANNLIRDPSDGTGKLINVNNTIAGAGKIGDGQMSLDNQASGAIDANVSTPLILYANSGGVTNEGLLEATSGGTLELDDSSVTQTGGLIEASGANSTVELVNSTTVTGGTLTTANSGTLGTATNQTSTLDDVTVSSGSTFTAANDSITFLEGTLTNDGTVDLDAAANGTELRTEPGATLTLTGGGAINLSNSANNLIRDPSDGTGKLVNVNNTIAGAGNIGDGQMSLDNQASGVIDANVPTTLILQPNSTGFTNEGLLEATNGGTLELDGSSFTQSGGVIEANGANSTVELVSNTTVIGGTLTTASGGTLETAANQTATLDNVTISSGSTFTGMNNSLTFLEGTITNAGTIALAGGANDTELRPEPGATLTLTGGGVVDLSNSASNLIRDPSEGTAELINVNNTIEGAGNIGSGQMSFDNESGGVVDANVSTPLIIDPNATGVTNAGTFEATNGGLLDVTSALNGGGRIVIGAGSEVELGGASGEAATFAGTTGELRVGTPQTSNYTGTITSFAANDVLALGSTNATTATPGTFNGTTTSLIVNLNGGGSLTYQLAGNYTGDTFSVTHASGDSDISVVVPTSGTLSVSAPSAAVVGVGQASTITPAVSITESPTTGGETFIAVLSDNAGVLSASTSVQNGGGTITPSNGGKTLTISGSLAQVDADLTTLVDTEPTTTSDTITVSSTDSNGGSAGPATIAVTVNGLPTISAPGSVAVGDNKTFDFTGGNTISVGETGNPGSPETFTVVLSDTNGLLAATTSGSASVQNSGTTKLTVSGSLTDVNNTLASLSDTDGTTGSDPITVKATDSFGNSGTTSVGVTVNTVPSINAPPSASVTSGVASNVTGFSLSETGSTGTPETFSITLSDINGVLSATQSGSASLQSSNAGKTLLISGSLIDVNNTLESLKDTDSITPSDTITANAADSFGNTAMQKTTPVTVSSGTTLSIVAPSGEVVGVGQASPLGGISLSEPGAQSGTQFTVMVSDSHGLLNATASGAASVQNSGTTKITISGSLTDVNNTLLSLSDTDATTPSDTLTITASDNQNDTAGPTTVPVTVNGAPTVSAPGSVVLGDNKTFDFTGGNTISVGEMGNTGSPETFTVVLSDTNGLLAATKSGSASVQNSGTTKLTISGSLTDVDNTLASLSDTDGTTGSDPITVKATDSFGNSGTTSVGVTVNTMPSINAPPSASVTSGVASNVTGFSLSETGSTGTPETFSITLSDINGVLSATQSGSASLQSSNAGKTLLISGSLIDVNNTLESLKDTDSITPSDTITANAADSFGNTAMQKTTPVTVSSGTTLSIVAPSGEVVGVGQASPLGGISLSEPGAQSGTQFTVMVSDSHGLLNATASGAASVQNSGTTKITISGSLTDVNNTLQSLSDTDATTPSDTLTITASDNQNDTAGPTTVPVTVNGAPTVSAPTAVTETLGTPFSFTGGDLVSVAETGTTGSPETFSVTLTDTNGLLAATKSGSAVVKNSGTTKLTISGSLTDVDNTLESLTDTENSSSPDTITVAASDSFGNAGSAEIAVTVSASGQTYTLTRGVDNVNGGPGDNTIVAASNTLSSGDQINGGSSGDNTLQLSGAGIFDLALPSSLTNVQYVDAQEGQPASGSNLAENQDITLRSGLNVTVNVSPATINPSNSKAPTITVNGANDSSVINLASGNDAVTLGSKNETVNGGTGADQIAVSASTIGANITGGTGGSTLEVVGAGTNITMGTNITNISQVLLLGSPSAMSFIANGISGLTVTDDNTGADTVTAGGTGQTLTGGGAGKETFIGFTGGSTTFQDKTATISGDTIQNFFAANSKIDITDMNFSTLHTPTYVNGKLTVTDGTHTAVITLTGTEPAGSFTTQQDSGTGTLIGFHPTAV